jgi:hypothetical protein
MPAIGIYLLDLFLRWRTLRLRLVGVWHEQAGEYRWYATNAPRSQLHPLPSPPGAKASTIEGVTCQLDGLTCQPKRGSLAPFATR